MTARQDLFIYLFIFLVSSPTARDDKSHLKNSMNTICIYAFGEDRIVAYVHFTEVGGRGVHMCACMHAACA